MTNRIYASRPQRVTPIAIALVAAIAFAAALGTTASAHEVVGAAPAARDRPADPTSPRSISEVQPTLDQLHAVRDAIAPYEHVDAALAAGFERFGECMHGPQGAQGIHFTHGERIGDPVLDALRPEVLMYEPRLDGSLRLIGVEYLVFQDAWHASGNVAPPVLLGREFTLNTTLLDEAFYALHVWVWQHNPLGLFANWNPLIGCGQDTSGHGG
jgi:hypothetical protein